MIEKIIAGVYRMQYLNRYFWIVREGKGRKWKWYPGGYHGYPPWEEGYGFFASLKEAKKDIVRSFLN